MNLARSKSLIALLLTAATAVIAPAAEKPNIEKLHVVLLADEKDHGPAGNGLHDYPLWQKRWALLLGGEEASDEKQVNLVGPPDKDTDYGEGIPNVEVATAWHWPSEEHFQTADVIVAYCYLEWTDERLAMDFDPGMPLTHSPITRAAILASGWRNPWPSAIHKFRGSTPSLTLWLTIRLSLSTAYLVTSIYIKFRSGLVANL